MFGLADRAGADIPEPALLPELEERIAQERESSGLPFHVGQKQFHQPRLELSSRHLRGFFDDLTKFGFSQKFFDQIKSADPRGLHYSQSGDFVMMAVMGGMRRFWGPLLGAAVFVVLQDYLSSVTVNWMSFVGMLFVAIVLFFPRGLLGVWQRRSQP